MERIEAVNLSRIVWCCADYGISMDELAAEVGISARTIERVEAGKGGLTFNQLRGIAEFFGRGVLFFLDPEPADKSSVHSPAFRSISNQRPELSAKLRVFIERVERQRAVYLDLFEELEGARPPEFTPPSLRGKRVASQGAAVRSWLGLSDRNTFDTFRRAVEAKHVLVFRSNGYLGKWNIPKDNPIIGFAIWKKTCPVIVVKADKSEGRQSFTLMHELAHLLLHRSSTVDDEDSFHSNEGREREANALAGHILVPPSFLEEIDDRHRPVNVSGYDDWLAGKTKAWGVTSEVILRRLLDSNRLSSADYNGYRAWRASIAPEDSDGGSRMYRHREPKHIFGDHFVRRVLDSLATGAITLTKATSYLDGIKVSDLHALEDHYAHA